MRDALHDCLIRGEAPLASHLLYTQKGVLNDDKPEERMLGIEAGLVWGKFAEKTIVYTDLGFSNGMKMGIERAQKEGREIEYRTIPGWTLKIEEYDRLDHEFENDHQGNPDLRTGSLKV